MCTVSGMRPTSTLGSSMFRALIAIALVLGAAGTRLPRPLIKPHLATTHTRAGTYRLPGEVIPENYNIKLVPYFTEGGDREFTFDGQVQITVEAVQAAQTITLHINDIIIGETSVRSLQGDELVVTAISRDIDRDFLVLALDQPLVPGTKYQLSIGYVGQLRDGSNGFYRKSYTEDGETRWLGTTHFEATKARRAFPCFDEPALKATFDISIARLPSMHAISNMPVLSTSDPDPTVGGRQWDTFQTSVRMSTYLVAFVVSDYKAVQNGSYGIWSYPNTVEQGRYSLEISPIVIGAMEVFTGIEYKLPKLDQAAIPDFGGAMENWGLVIYGRSALLLAEGDPEEKKMNIADIISHELGHQWFGNLVTLDWWKYTWLNEGFATFFANFAADKVDPSWNRPDALVVEKQQPVMETDSMTSHPITIDVETPGEISGTFDSITYSKGGSIIKMMYMFLGYDTFYKGLNRYLTQRSFQSAVANDLFSAVQEQVEQDKALPDDLTIKLIMDTWTLQAGYPVLNVTRDYQAGTASVDQKRFFSSSTEPSNSKWYVPVSYTTQRELQFEDARPQQWLTVDSSLTLEGLPGSDQWIILNIQAAGFFRVNYDQANWKLLIDTLNSANYEQIHTLNRAQLIDDANHLGINQQLNIETAMEVTTYLARETNYIPWVPAFRQLENLYQKMGASEAFPDLQVYYLHLMKNLYNSVGFEAKHGESPLVKLARDKVVHWACLLGHDDCLDKSAQLLNIWMTNPTYNRISADLRPDVYCAAVRRSGERVWSFLWEQYLTSDDKSERHTILKALGCTTDPELLNRFMNMAISEDSGLKQQDHFNVFSAVLNGRDATNADIALQFLFDNFLAIESFFGEHESVSTVIYRMASKLNKQSQIDLLRQFIDSNEERMRPVEETAMSGLRNAEERLVWLRAQGADIARWLRRQRQ